MDFLGTGLCIADVEKYGQLFSASKNGVEMQNHSPCPFHKPISSDTLSNGLGIKLKKSPRQQFLKIKRPACLAF